jgi:hypothetical protein
MSESVARTKIFGVRPNGERIEIEFSVGHPYQADPECWRTPVTLTPLYKNLAHAAGGDAVQSLCMALSLGIDLLAKFREDGGKLLYDDGTEFTLEPYSFGHAQRKTGGA